MTDILGTTLPVFVGLTVVIMGFAAFMTGLVLANTWRPVWQAVFYAVLLGFGDRFLTFALFEGELLSLTGYVIDTAVLIGIALFALLMGWAVNVAYQLFGITPMVRISAHDHSTPGVVATAGGVILILLLLCSAWRLWGPSPATQPSGDKP